MPSPASKMIERTKTRTMADFESKTNAKFIVNLFLLFSKGVRFVGEENYSR